MFERALNRLLYILALHDLTHQHRHKFAHGVLTHLKLAFDADHVADLRFAAQDLPEPLRVARGQNYQLQLIFLVGSPKAGPLLLTDSLREGRYPLLRLEGEAVRRSVAAQHEDARLEVDRFLQTLDVQGHGGNPYLAADSF